MREIIMEQNNRITCRVMGRVQMVMFRDFSQRKARKLRLRGFVKNEIDGSVTVIAEGSRELLERYIAYLQKGSILSRVENVEVQWGGATNKVKNFKIQQ